MRTCWPSSQYSIVFLSLGVVACRPHSMHKLGIEIEMHNKKRWSTFDAKHASLIAAHKEATKLARKASTQYGSTKRRIARKGGWGCSSYRDVLRSPYERDDEEDDM